MEKKPRKKEINNMKGKKANKVNNNFKLNVDEQQDDINRQRGQRHPDGCNCKF